MSDALGEEGLVTFGVGRAVYALPISDVLEVTEVAPLACIPTLPATIGGVMNHHGDALPVISRSLIFEVDEAELGPPTQLLVLAPGGDRSTRNVGLPVDRIFGLTSGRAAAAREGGLVVERRPIDGRVVNILDPRRLVQRAEEAIGRAVATADNQGGSG